MRLQCRKTPKSSFADQPVSVDPIKLNQPFTPSINFLKTVREVVEPDLQWLLRKPKLKTRFSSTRQTAVTTRNPHKHSVNLLYNYTHSYHCPNSKCLGEFKKFIVNEKKKRRVLKKKFASPAKVAGGNEKMKFTKNDYPYTPETRNKASWNVFPLVDVENRTGGG